MSIKIIHISDFHLNNNNLRDWNDFLKTNFIQFINENKFDDAFIVCSGDMVDKGGLDFGGISAGLEKFREEIINPIVSQTGITIDRFILAPGNHDIDRNADKDYIRDGLRENIKANGVDKINEYVRDILEDRGMPAMRVYAYYDFVQKLYKGCENITNYYLGSVYNYDVNGKRLTFTSFNTAWNCCDDDDRKWGLAIGEPQYRVCNSNIPNNAVRIAVMHHPLDWLLYEKKSIQVWMRNDYDLLLMGHVHENETMMTMNSMGNLIISFSPCFTNDIRNNSITYPNGFVVVDYDIDKKEIDFSFQVYNHKLRKYDINQDYANSGSFHAEIKEGVSNVLARLVDRCINHLRTKHIPEINDSIIPQKAKAIGTLNEAFVMPPLRKNGDLDNDVDYTLSSILNSQNNVILFGQHESGKTVLLNKLLMEYVDNESIFGVIPVYFDFDVQSNQGIDTIIKNYLDCNSAEAEMLIMNRKIVLLVDNYSIDESKINNAKKLYHFVDNKSIRIIATSNHEIIDNIPEQFVKSNEIPCECYFIHHFQSSNVKELIAKWSPDIQIMERNQKIEKLVNRFCSFSLPCTAMSVSLYLWSTENSNRDPVNPSILLDIYMEIILEKMSEENIFVNTFDYENKSSLLAFLAEIIHDKLRENNTFILTYGHYVMIIEDYLKRVGFKGIDAGRLAEYFIERKVFLRKNDHIEFAHACFYFFFLAKRMIKNPTFYSKVISPNEYFKYDRVIEYYSGLVRSDRKLLEFLNDQIEEVFSEVAFVYEEVNMDKCFTIIRNGQTGYTPIIQAVNPQKVVEQKLSEEENENKVLAIADEKLSRIADNFYEPKKLSPSALILVLSRVLRNSDGIEDLELKQKVYNSIVKNSMILTVIIKDQLALYANTHNGSLPSAYGFVKNVSVFFRFMPFALQATLGEIMATRKLVGFFESKYNKDVREKVSDIEKYFSIGMLWDSTGLDNKKIIKSFIKQVGNNSAQDYVFFKLLYCFNTQVVLGSEEEDQYIDLLVDLKVKQKMLKAIEKDKLKKHMKDVRNKKLIEKRKMNSDKQ